MNNFLIALRVKLNSLTLPIVYPPISTKMYWTPPKSPNKFRMP